jgi:hypothetical protein
MGQDVPVMSSKPQANHGNETHAQYGTDKISFHGIPKGLGVVRGKPQLFSRTEKKKEREKTKTKKGLFKRSLPTLAEDSWYGIQNSGWQSHTYQEVQCTLVEQCYTRRQRTQSDRPHRLNGHSVASPKGLVHSQQEVGTVPSGT